MNKLFLIPIIFLLALVFLLFILIPKISALGALKKEILNKEQELSLKQKDLNFVLNSLKEAKYYQATIDNLSTALPSDFFSADLLSFFQAQALKSGLIFKGISESQTQSQADISQTSALEPGLTAQAGLNSKIKEFNFFCQTQGSVEGFEAFLKQLELSSRIVEIEDFVFEVAPIGGQEQEMPEFDLSAKVYHY